MAVSDSPVLPYDPLATRKRWSRVDRLTRLFYLESCRANLRRVAPFWVEEEAALRGHSAQSEEGAEAWLTGPLMVARVLRYLEHGLRSGGRPLAPSHRSRIDGRNICRLFPQGIYEGIVFWDYQGDVWSVGPDARMQNYRKSKDLVRGLSLVLGPANIASITIIDALWKLFGENRPVVCLLPKRWATLASLFSEIAYPLVRDHHLHFVTGGVEEAKVLLEQPYFETVHLTGRESTLTSILSSNRYPQRIFTAQLGGVSPVILVPGSWSAEELNFQARELASQLVFHGGYHCATPQLVIAHAGWEQKHEFLEALRRELASLSIRDDLYPESSSRREEWRRHYPAGERYGPRTLVFVQPENEELVFAQEASCGVLGYLELDGEEVKDFLNKSVQFCNRKLSGDLCCQLVIDPLTRREHEVAIAHAISLLHYGTVTINTFAGLSFLSAVMPWGSYRGGSNQSGLGWTHNTFFIGCPEKSVLEGSFIPLPLPPWHKPFANLYEIGQKLFSLDLEPNYSNLAKLIAAYGIAKLKQRKSILNARE